MHTRRQDLLKELEEAVASAPMEGFYARCTDLCFQIVYGLPAEVSLRMACRICERYLPILEAKWPTESDPRKLFSDLAAWHRAEQLSRPVLPDEADAADVRFQNCFDHLVRGYQYRSDRVCAAAGACGAMADAASARAINVWIADDPKGAYIKRAMGEYTSIPEETRPPNPPFTYAEEADPDHDYDKNVAYAAVHRREWAAVVAQLKAEEVWKYPEPTDLDVMTEGLRRWDEHWGLPLIPVWAEQEGWARWERDAAEEAGDDVAEDK